MTKIPETQNLKKFFSEIFMLKRLKHEGVRLAGIEQPDSLAEHVALAAQIAFVLGKMEGADAYKCAVIELFHDNQEIRIGDLNKVAARYIKSQDALNQSEKDHFSNLDPEFAKEILNILQEKASNPTKEGLICRDADLLEMAIQAKINIELGYKGCQSWLDRIGPSLKTESGKLVFSLICNEPDLINIWWQGLKA